MGFAARSWVALICVCFVLPAWAQSGLSYGPPADWVEANTAPAPAATPSDSRGGLYYLLFDQQSRWARQGQREEYRHVAVHTLSAQGVEQIANLQLQFDPAHQSLVIHSVRLVRQGRAVDRLDRQRVQLLRRESGLDNLLFDGTVTASLVLEDVRVGDVVEYSYTRRGHNPVFRDQHFGSFDLQWSVPVKLAKSRLLWPTQRHLQWRSHNGAAAAEVRSLGDQTDYRWQQRDLPALTQDSEAPGWFDPYPWVEWSEYADWPAVVRWAQPLYAVTPAGLQAVRAQADLIRAQHSQPEQRLLAALLFVQQEVRYLGIEIGPNSHQPHEAAVVLKRRFGDCKDKTLLLITLLKALGIEARAALVHTTLQRALAGRLSSPGHFNHVLVQARLAGQLWWLDPTRTAQRGTSLSNWVQADFEQALVVDSASTGLVAMAGPQARHLQRQVHVVLDASAGRQAASSLEVRTEVAGAAAEQLRHEVASQGLESLQKGYQNFYAKSYPGLTVSQALEVQDDPDGNRIVTVERYSVPEYWSHNSAQQRYEGGVLTPDLLAYLRTPAQAQRTAPWALAHPMSLQLTTELRLHKPWKLTAEAHRFENKAFEATRQERWQGSTLWVEDRFTSRSDHLSADDAAKHTADVDKVRDALSFVLYDSTNTTGTISSSPHWLPTLLITLTLGAVGWGVRRLLRWDPEPAPMSDAERALAPAGWGGWLIVATLGLVIGLFRTLQSVVNGLPALSVEGWNSLTQLGAGAYHPAWVWVLSLEILTTLPLIAGQLLCLWLVVRARTSLPRLFQWVLLLSVAVNLMGWLCGHWIPAMALSDQERTQLLAGLLGACIWLAYFKKSRRVKATFVRRNTHPMAPKPIDLIDRQPGG